MLECILLLPQGVHWRNFRIRRLVYFFPSFLVVFRICFLILIRIYLWHLCCLIGPSHSVWWSLFVCRFFVGLTVFSLSTLNHNIFTYLDYVFSATFILTDFNPYLLLYIYIYIYIYIRGAFNKFPDHFSIGI